MNHFGALRKSVYNVREVSYAPGPEQEITASEASKAQFFV